jgi:transcriptional regulator with XRE-family HTH domain
MLVEQNSAAGEQMKTEQQTQQLTRFAEAVQDQMDTLKLSIRDVAIKTDSTYEHVRKLLRGGSFPSKYFLRVLAEVLELDINDLERLLTADKIQHKFGTIPMELAGKKPGMEPLERVWDNLSSAHQSALIEQAQSLAKMDKRERKRG